MGMRRGRGHDPRCSRGGSGGIDVLLLLDQDLLLRRSVVVLLVVHIRINVGGVHTLHHVPHEPLRIGGVFSWVCYLLVRGHDPRCTAHVTHVHHTVDALRAAQGHRVGRRHRTLDNRGLCVQRQRPVCRLVEVQRRDLRPLRRFTGQIFGFHPRRVL